jgi:subtilisin family serine protease
LIAVQLKDSSVMENLPARVSRDLNLPVNVRFFRKFPGQRVGIFHCSKDKRDQIMNALRTQTDVVQYCSHVLQRDLNSYMPGMEIGLDNKIFIEFKRKPSRKNINRIEQAHGLRAIWRFTENLKGIVFELTSQAKVNPIKISKTLMHSGSYETVEPCLIDAKVSKAIPSDAAFSRQWHLLNTGQGGGIPGADCNATEAWDYTWGSPEITVALIDDGFDLFHPDFDLPEKIIAPYDATGRDSNPQPEHFSENHGTSCAGVALAARGSGIAVGVAPDCSFMPIRHAGRLGDFEEALAFYHAFRNKADVISCSWGPWDGYKPELWPMPRLTQYVIDICVSFGRDGKGIPIFFAAGNGNEPLKWDGYANYKKVIAVAACTNEDKKAYYSDYGKNVWVTAPSSGGTLGIFTTDRLGAQGYSWDSDYTGEFGGTSAATPLVAGVVALILSVNKDLTVNQIKQILKETAVKINKNNSTQYSDTWGNKYSDEYVNGHSQVYGWGRIDAGAAVAKAHSTNAFS